MKPMLRIMAALFGLFMVIFLVGNLTGWITVSQVEGWLTWAGGINAWVVGIVIIGLLTLDMVLALPTILIVLLSGFFLGPVLGAAVSLIGVSLAISGGYLIGRLCGAGSLRYVIRDATEQKRLTQCFERHGPGLIILARGVPMMPEVTAILAGATRMSFSRFSALFLAGTVPFVSIAAVAGAHSDFNNPWPAIYGVMGLYSAIWGAWATNRIITDRAQTPHPVNATPNSKPRGKARASAPNA